MCLEFLIGVLPLTLGGISYERVKSLPRIHNVKCVFPVWKVLLFTWGVSGFLSFPRFLAYEYFTNENFTNDGYENGSSSLGDSLGEFTSLNFSSNDTHAALVCISECRKVCLCGEIGWLFMHLKMFD